MTNKHIQKIKKRINECFNYGHKISKRKLNIKENYY